MAKRVKRRRGRPTPSSTVQVKDVIFQTLVHDEKATIMAEQGIVFLKSEDKEGTVYPIPAGIKVVPEMYGQGCDVTVRDVTNEVILSLDEDDVYEEDLQSDDRLMSVGSTMELEEIYNERKIQIFTQIAGTLSTFVGGCTLSGLCYWLLGKEFPYRFLLYGGLGAGVLLGTFFGLAPGVRRFRQLSSKIVSDGAGNWVNMETGQSNLNGGMVIPVKKGR